MGSDDSGSEEGSGGSEGSSEEEEDEDEEEKEEKNASTIIDNTETNLIALRRTIYLTIQSSLDFQECAHKLMKMELKPGQEIELCHMFLGKICNYRNRLWNTVKFTLIKFSFVT